MCTHNIPTLTSTLPNKNSAKVWNHFMAQCLQENTRRGWIIMRKFVYNCNSWYVVPLICRYWEQWLILIASRSVYIQFIPGLLFFPTNCLPVNPPLFFTCSLNWYNCSIFLVLVSKNSESKHFFCTIAWSDVLTEHSLIITSFSVTLKEEFNV